MVAICYSSPITAVSTNEQFFSEKKACETFQIDISKMERLVHEYTDRQSNMAESNLLVTLTNYILTYIFYGAKNIVANLIYPVQDIKNISK